MKGVKADCLFYDEHMRSYSPVCVRKILAAALLSRLLSAFEPSRVQYSTTERYSAVLCALASNFSNVQVWRGKRQQRILPLSIRAFSTGHQKFTTGLSSGSHESSRISLG